MQSRKTQDPGNQPVSNPPPKDKYPDGTLGKRWLMAKGATSMFRGLLIRRPWVDMILDGKKSWEIRGSRTAIRGVIGLIPSGSGTIAGVCEIVDCIGPLTANALRKNAVNAGMRPSEARLGGYRNTFAWVLAKPRYLKKPVPYKHPSGAVIWVCLDGKVERAIRNQL
jgi:hypothetical protein